MNKVLQKLNGHCYMLIAHCDSKFLTNWDYSNKSKSHKVSLF